MFGTAKILMLMHVGTMPEYAVAVLIIIEVSSQQASRCTPCVKKPIIHDSVRLAMVGGWRTIYLLHCSSYCCYISNLKKLLNMRIRFNSSPTHIKV